MRNDPRTLLNTPYPLIVPAFRKSSGETIDETLQPPNETLSTSRRTGTAHVVEGNASGSVRVCDSASLLLHRRASRAV
jgi:hypothetical protein